jgi:hypothetical protein
MRDPDDKGPFSIAMAALLETFGQQATKPTLYGYWLGLNDLPLESVQAAVATAIRSADRLPRPVELRRFAGEQTGEQRAIAAWSDVMAAVPLGPYKHIDFGDKLVNASIRSLGGWPSFLQRFGDAESEKWVRLDFLKTYTALLAGGVTGEACEPLPGISVAEATGGVVGDPVPRRIACSPDRAAQPKLAGATREIQLAFRALPTS